MEPEPDEASRRSAACGFADQSHLTRQFHRAYGVTPGRWRALQNPPGAMR